METNFTLLHQGSKKVSQLNDENGGMLVVNINNQTYPNWKGVFHCKIGRTWADRDKKNIWIF